MKAIQVYNNDSMTWDYIGSGYCGLSADEAKKNINQLIKWAAADNSGKEYRIINVDLTPK